MTPESLEALAVRVETEEPSDELTAAVLTAFGCESEPDTAPEPLTRVEDAHAFRPAKWFLWSLCEPGPGITWHAVLMRSMGIELIPGTAPPNPKPEPPRTSARWRGRRGTLDTAGRSRSLGTGGYSPAA